MATNLERRIERLEEAILPTKPAFIVFDFMQTGGREAYESYLANTPEDERASVIVTIDDPTRGCEVQNSNETAGVTGP